MGGRLDTPHFHKAQIVVVQAAGNDEANMCWAHYDPVNTPAKLIVGSTTRSDQLSKFSNYGACVHVQVLLPAAPLRSAHPPLAPAPALTRPC